MATLFLFRFFNRFFPEVAFPATLISVLFAPIFYNSFICTNFSIFFFFLVGALVFLEFLPLFLLFSIITSLSRPEGILPYLFLCALYLVLNKNFKQNWWKFALGFLPVFLILFYNLLSTGQLMHQGAISQSLFHYDSIFSVLKYGALNFTDHLKGTLLGLYHTREWFGIDQRGNTLYTLPPLLFIFCLIGFLNKERRHLAIFTSSFLFILIAGDSLTLFTGLHFNRRILPIFPLLFAFSFIGIKEINKRIKGFYPAILIFFSLFFISQEFLILSHFEDNIALSQKGKEIAQWLKENLPRGTPVFHGASGDNSVSYWDDHTRRVFLTPNLNPVFSRYIDSFWKTTEAAELIQRHLTKVKYLFIGSEKGPLTNWLKGFSTDNPVVFSWIGEKEKYYLYPIDLTPLSKKRFDKGIIDEIDIGDPESESIHNYKRVDFSRMSMRELPKKIDGIYDGSRVTEGTESFSAKYQGKSNILVCLLGNSFNGRKIDIKRSPLSFTIKEANFQIIIEGKELAKGKIEDDFQLLNIYLPFVIKNDSINIKVVGRFVSYHYWIMKEM